MEDDESDWKIELGDQPKDMLNKLIGEGKTKEYVEIIQEFDKILEDPIAASQPVFTEYNEDVMNKLASYYGKYIYRMGTYGECPIFGGETVDIGVDDLCIDMIGVTMFYDNELVLLEELVENMGKNIFYFRSVEYVIQSYKLKFSNDNKNEIVFDARGIILGDEE